MILYHAANVYTTTDERERERMNRAQKTWKNLLSTRSDCLRTAYSSVYARTSKDLGDRRSIPFVKDVIDVGIKKCSAGDAVMLTNSDSSLCVETADYVFEGLFEHGACYSSRMDMDKIHRGWLTHDDITQRGHPFIGVDLVAFTYKWWIDRGHEYPDMLLGFSGWDWIFKFIIGHEIPTAVYHEYHGIPTWHREFYTSAGQFHNRKLAKEWVTSRSDYNEIKKKWPDVDKLERPPLIPRTL